MHLRWSLIIHYSFNSLTPRESLHLSIADTIWTSVPALPAQTTAPFFHFKSFLPLFLLSTSHHLYIFDYCSKTFASFLSLPAIICIIIIIVIVMECSLNWGFRITRAQSFPRPHLAKIFKMCSAGNMSSASLPSCARVSITRVARGKV